MSSAEERRTTWEEVRTIVEVGEVGSHEANEEVRKLAVKSRKTEAEALIFFF